MYNARVLPTNLPVKVIGMNSSISTPFDRQSTVNKSIERWCERTRRKWRVQGGLYMCVFIRQVSDSFLFCCPITFGVNIYTKISTNHLLQISLFYLSLNPRSPAPYMNTGLFTYIKIQFLIRFPSTVKGCLIGESLGRVKLQLLTVVN